LTLFIACVIYLYYERVSEHGTVDIFMKRNRRLRQTLYILFVIYLCYKSVTEDGRGDRNEEWKENVATANRAVKERLNTRREVDVLSLAVPLQGPEGSRRLRLPDFKTIGT